MRNNMKLDDTKVDDAWIEEQVIDRRLPCIVIKCDDITCNLGIYGMWGIRAGPCPTCLGTGIQEVKLLAPYQRILSQIRYARDKEPTLQQVAIMHQLIDYAVEATGYYE